MKKHDIVLVAERKRKEERKRKTTLVEMRP